MSFALSISPHFLSPRRSEFDAHANLYAPKGCLQFRTGTDGHSIPLRKESKFELGRRRRLATYSSLSNVFSVIQHDTILDFGEIFSTLIHNPWLTLASVAIVLYTVPKITKTVIQYLARPIIFCLLGWSIISHPTESFAFASNVYEFIEDHPVITSIGTLILAGLLLTPYLFYVSAVSGIIILLGSFVLEKDTELPPSVQNSVQGITSTYKRVSSASRFLGLGSLPIPESLQELIAPQPKKQLKTSESSLPVKKMDSGKMDSILENS